MYDKNIAAKENYMTTIVMDKKDEIVMKLVHYFITEENYNPIVVNGVKDEIWLENAKGPYRIVRINSNNIFNKEQLKYDYYKIDSIVRQIKKKTFSFNVSTLNILLDVNEDLKIEQDEQFENIVAVPLLNKDLDITDKNILEAFPNINEKLIKDTNGVELIMNVTKDINNKTERENQLYEKVFSPKKIFVTPTIIAICFIMFIIGILFDGVGAIVELSADTGLKIGANWLPYIKSGQVWRLISSIFIHWSLIHLILNMYTLFIVGTQIETFLGKIKYIFIFLISGLCGSLLSCVINDVNIVSAGASGAIFGLFGALMYFGYHYRNYLGNVVKTQLMPLLLFNLAIGFVPGLGIDGFAHLGGLVGGTLCAMALGIENKSSKTESINGIVCLTILIGFLSYMIFK